VIQPATLTEREAAGDKHISIYFDCDDLKLLLLLLMMRLRSGRWNFVVIEAESCG